MDRSPEREERRQTPGEGEREAAEGRSPEKEVNATKETGDARELQRTSLDCTSQRETQAG